MSDEPVEEFLRTRVYYGKGYRDAVQNLRDFRRGIDNCPVPAFRRAILDSLNIIVESTVNACKAVYEPQVPVEDRRGTTEELEANKAGLAKLAEIFKR